MGFWNYSYEYWKTTAKKKKKIRSGRNFKSFNGKLRVVQQWGKACTNTEIAEMSSVTLGSQKWNTSSSETQVLDFNRILITVFLWRFSI